MGSVQPAQQPRQLDLCCWGSRLVPIVACGYQARPERGTQCVNGNGEYGGFSFSKEEGEGRHVRTEKGRLGGEISAGLHASSLARRPGWDKFCFHFHLPTRNLPPAGGGSPGRPGQGPGRLPGASPGPRQGAQGAGLGRTTPSRPVGSFCARSGAPLPCLQTAARFPRTACPE